MRRHGVLLTVLFALSVTLLSVSYTFWELYKLNKTQYIDSIYTKHTVILQLYREHIQKRTSPAMFEANLAINKFRFVNERAEHQAVIRFGEVLKSESYQTSSKQFLIPNQLYINRINREDVVVSMIEYKRDIFFLIKGDGKEALLIDERLKPYTPWNLFTAYLSILSIIVISFILILQRLRPLRRLQTKIARYGAGNMEVGFKMRGEDEIALISNELEATRLKINALIESRTLFLRNIMHELKTPITKGRIASQMLTDSKQQQRFNGIFERMEVLISEFALIEEVTSGSQVEEASEYRLIDVIDGAIDMAMVEREAVDVAVDAGVKVEVDFRLYATAIKNMIDNAIKYSPDGKVRIYMKGNEIYFENRGEKLQHPLAYYVEPFTKDQPSKNSFGLGLYLVDSILKSHAQVLAYEYVDGNSCFIFTQ
ncbi:MAG TPA: HAMP domain-containing histidine kinase [Helicobacteraceae bacterium]|nr:HAMP domain-containing histidine kinase [Helicobacteraceae bacterium]